MKTKIHRLVLAGSTVLVLALAGAAGAQAVNPGDCNAVRPPVGETTGDPTARLPSTAVPRDALSNQLATCGSVLNPPAVGDHDVVQPAPAIDDPMAIHPNEVPKNNLIK